MKFNMDKKINIFSLFMFSFTISAANAALTATTANTIQGTAPRFTPAIESAIQNKDFPLFGVTYKGEEYFDSALLGDKISLEFYDGYVNSISDLNLTMALATPTSSDVIDLDGDSASLNPIQAQTSITAKWYQKYNGVEYDITGQTVINSPLCSLVYEERLIFLKIKGDIILQTTYGDPSSQLYPDSSLGVTTTPERNFYINFYGGVCLAKLTYDGLSKYVDTSRSWWRSGYKPQSTGNDNFPTTGADGLHFDLIVAGYDATKLKWPGFTSGYPALQDKGITVTVTDVKSTSVQIQLSGPKANQFTDGATADKFQGTPLSPASFTLKGVDSRGNVAISYPFAIKEWYVSRGTVTDTQSIQRTWCENLSTTAGTADYTLPSISDLTNANNATGNTNHYVRNIGEGFFSEWGTIGENSGSFPATSSSPTVYYWTNKNDGYGNGYVIGFSSSSYGAIGLNGENNKSKYAICKANN